MQFLSLDPKEICLTPTVDQCERNRHANTAKTGDVKVQSGFGLAKTTFKTTLKTAPKWGPFSTLNVPILSPVSVLVRVTI